MKWLEARVVLENEAAIRAADVISAFFADLGAMGTVLDDPTLEPEEGWGSDAVPLPEKFAVTGYLPAQDRLEEKTGALEEKLKALETHEAIDYGLAYRWMDEEDWAESWKQHFQPLRLTDRIVIKPTWREFHEAPGDLIIELDPGMAFGAGTHPTTASCVKMIEKYLKPESRFLDVGTGSGILMLAAAKLGAFRMVGVDVDETAVRVAESNLILNSVDPACYDLYAGDLVSCVKDRFDLVTANILSEVVLRLLEDLPKVMKENGVVILSGIVEKNSPKVLEKMKSTGLDVLEVYGMDGWATLVGRVVRSDQ